MKEMEMDLEKTRKSLRREDIEMDRLSDLPYPIIYHILSLTDTKNAVQTCILSKRWKKFWTDICGLSFDVRSFSNWKVFKKFVLTVLEKRKPYDLSSLKLFCGRTRDLHLINSILDYAKSCNVVELEIDCYGFPQGYFSCETLKSLKLGPGTIKEIPIPFDFTSLTTLQLFRVDSSYISPTYEVFPGCVNLENLRIIECNFSNLWLLEIDAPSLVNLTIMDLEFEGILGIAAAKLKYLYYSGNCPAMWEIDEFPALEKVDVIIHEVQEQFDVIRWAQKILHAKSVAISFDTCDGEQFLLSKTSSRGRNRLFPEH